MKARVRGIYTSALTKLLLDNGFQIVQPSATIKERFRLTDDLLPPDMKIKDRYDLQGVRVLGTFDSVNMFRDVLHSEFENAITRKWSASVDGIYRGKIAKSEGETIFVDIGNGVVGLLPNLQDISANKPLLLVQVERRRMGAKQPILTTDLKIVGDYAILVHNSRGGVSFRIRDFDRRSELYSLGKTLAPEGWGVIWRESSARQSADTLKDEIAELAKKIEVLKENASKDSPALLLEGLCSMDVEFPSLSKRNMDKLRASAAPTLVGHHFYKSCGGKVSAALEMAEKLLEKTEDRNEVAVSFEKEIRNEFPEIGSIVNVEHVKLSGRVLHLGEATIEEFNDKQIKYARTMKSSGFYDGLETEREAGDKAVSEAKANDWCITTEYFSEDGEKKGKYVNLNTPVELYPDAIRYVDLEVDICIKPDGTVKVLDMEKLEKAFEDSLISRALFERVKAKTKEIASQL